MTDDKPDKPADESREEMCKNFRNELEHLLNRNSMENGSDTPDFILAEYLMGCIKVFDVALEKREEWYGRKTGDWHSESATERGQN